MVQTRPAKCADFSWTIPYFRPCAGCPGKRVICPDVQRKENRYKPIEDKVGWSGRFTCQLCVICDYSAISKWNRHIIHQK